nr:hypothetical protein [Luteibacter rhizovicinus]
MSDTIELLEAIGRDASLRHASSEDLTSALRQAQASEALTSAVSSGDRAPLAQEFGHNANYQPQATQTGGYEDDVPDQGDTEKSDTPSEPDKTPADKPTK